MEGVVTPEAVKRRSLAAGTIGNLVEWFDWSVYGFFAPYLAVSFFPTTSSTHTTKALFISTTPTILRSICTTATLSIWKTCYKTVRLFRARSLKSRTAFLRLVISQRKL